MSLALPDGEKDMDWALIKYEPQQISDTMIKIPAFKNQWLKNNGP